MTPNEWAERIFVRYQDLGLSDLCSLLDAFRILDKALGDKKLKAELDSKLFEEEKCLIPLEDLFPYGRGENCVLDCIFEDEEYGDR